MLDRGLGGKLTVLCPLFCTYGHHAVTDNFGIATVFPQARQLGFNETSNWHVTSLVETSATSWVESDAPDNTASFDPQRDTPGPAVLAATLNLIKSVRHHRVRLPVRPAAGVLRQRQLYLVAAQIA